MQQDAYSFSKITNTRHDDKAYQFASLGTITLRRENV